MNQSANGVTHFLPGTKMAPGRKSTTREGPLSQKLGISTFVMVFLSVQGKIYRHDSIARLVSDSGPN
jgi:hypothetical protein